MTIKLSAKRNARIRKKLRVDEFQELGFDVYWCFNEEVSEEQIDDIVDQFVNEVIEPNKLGFSGGGHKAWEGLVCTQAVGKCTEEHRQLVEAFWNKQPASEVKVTQLYDLWWG